MTGSSWRTRFAPSPTGYLHLGHAASAWHVWTWAEHFDATVLLRIEDIDTTRCRPEYTEAIFTDLRWLGLSWPDPVRTQSQHFAAYAKCVENLVDRGLAYRCFRTRSELKDSQTPFQGGPLAPHDEAEKLARSMPFAWRLSMRAARAVLGPDWDALTYRLMQDGQILTRKAIPDFEGDVVIARKDSPSAYHLAATHDDALQGISHIIRGDDLKDAVHVHTLLQVLMGWPQPIYVHHPLVLDTTGRKLSKRANSPALAALRAKGITAKQIWEQLGLD